MSDWLAWQIVDTAFPTGAFAHSAGLEAVWQQGALEELGGLEGFVEATAWQVGYGALPLLSDAHRDLRRLERLDALADVFLLNAVANRASRTQGRALVETSARVWPSDAVRDMRRRAAGTRAHVAPLSGAVMRALDLPLGTAQRVALYGATRGVLSAAVRLGIAGSYEAQRLQHASAPLLDAVLARCAALGSADLTQTAPLLDTLHGAHDRLYSRLFQS